MNRLLDSAFRRVVRHGHLEVAWASGATSRFGSLHQRNTLGPARRHVAHLLDIRLYCGVLSGAPAPPGKHR